ncbi:DUF2490 domain-containing protein [Algoriphagus litoralis]|uniref:DUF2490 domain-containing protein n=1 Tax=Algoriphagus litoralis TaxID=2202829 RepID=UPI000DB967A0|nr:DUF2490 domain-containing protein [Algoriphagus litoralis]
MKKFLFAFVFLGGLGELKAQEKPVFFTGIFPELSLTKRINTLHKINFKVENQEVIFDNREGENLQFTHYRTDLMLFFDRNVRPGMSVALGVFHRFQEDEDANRIIQQLAVLQRMRNLRINHRFRTDQTFTRNEALEFRFRYRFSLEIPLEGAEVDPGELYVVISDEPIFSSQAGEFEIENRLVLSLGKLINKQQKLEWAVDYRTDGFVQEGFRTRLWAKISYYYNF